MPEVLVPNERSQQSSDDCHLDGADDVHMPRGLSVALPTRILSIERRTDFLKLG